MNSTTRLGMSQAGATVQRTGVGRRGRTRRLAIALAIAATTRAAVAQEYSFFTLAGPDSAPGAVDGSGGAARFNWPSGVAADSAGNLYVADTRNNLIRKVTPDGAVTTAAGWVGSWCSVDGMGSAAWFLNPSGVAVDNAGNVYVADTYNYTIRKVTPGGVVTTLAGLTGVAGTADGIGSAARVCGPTGGSSGWGGQRVCGGNLRPSKGDAGRRRDDPGGRGLVPDRRQHERHGQRGAVQFPTGRVRGQRRQRLCGRHVE